MNDSRIKNNRKKLRERTNRAKLKLQEDKFDDIAAKYKNIMIFLAYKDEASALCLDNGLPQNHN